MACRAWRVYLCFPYLISVTVNVTNLLYRMFILHQTNPQCQCRFKMWPMHDLPERWATQTQRFSLPSSLGPELSRFWGNRTTVSHQPPLPFSQTITFSLPLCFLFTASVSAVAGCLAAVGCWESRVFSVLWPPRMWQRLGSVSPRGLGLWKISPFLFVYPTEPYRGDTNPACNAYYELVLVFMSLVSMRVLSLHAC